MVYTGIARSFDNETLLSLTDIYNKAIRAAKPHTSL